MFARDRLHRAITPGLILALLVIQFGCAVDTLKKPIADFQAATSVVTAQARLSYGEINRVERIRAIHTARRLNRPLLLKELEAETTFLTGEDLAARLDALDHLTDYASLLSQIVSSDAPDKIATSASNLETALNGLAARIDKLNAAPAGGGAATSTSPSTVNFKNKFGVFASVVREVLGFLAKKKQNDALKSAIKDGDAPVNDLIEAIKSDLHLNYLIKEANIDHDTVDVFKAYNTEVLKPQPDKNKLDGFEQAIIDNLEAQDTFRATDPSDALDKMKKAHSKMVAYASQDSEANLNEALAAIQSFVGSATRLGTAVIKLKS